MAKKFAIEGNYLTIVDSVSAKAEQPFDAGTTNFAVRGTKITVFDTNNPDGHNFRVDYSVVLDKDGISFGAQSVFETWLKENTGFNSAAGGSVALVNAFRTRVLADSGIFEGYDSLKLWVKTNYSLIKNASLVLTPNAYKNSKLFALVPSDGTGDLTWTRASTKTRVNPLQLVEGIGANIPSIDYGSGTGAILVEPQRTNLILNSNNPSLWSTRGATVTLNYGISPSGMQDSSRLIFSDANFEHSQLFTSVSGVTGSLWVKGILGETIKFGLTNNESLFVLNGNWQRLEMFALGAATKIGVNTFSGATARNIEIWEAQVEAGTYKTSNIPTVASTVTRIGDVVSKTGISSLIGSKQGTVILDIAALANDGTNRVISVSDGTISNRIVFLYSQNNTQFISRIITPVSDFVSTVTLADNTQFNKIAVTYNETNMSIWANGILIETVATGTLFPENTLNRFGFDNGIGSNHFYGKVKGIEIYKTVLSDEEIIQLTT